MVQGLSKMKKKNPTIKEIKDVDALLECEDCKRKEIINISELVYNGVPICCLGLEMDISYLLINE